MKVGDLVVRKSYDRDITFKIIDVKVNEEGKDIYNKFNLEDKLGSMNLNDDVAQIYAKKQISILQAKLGLKNTFFLSAYEAFLEQYRNIYISSLTIDEDPVISK